MRVIFRFARANGVTGRASTCGVTRCRMEPNTKRKKFLRNYENLGKVRVFNEWKESKTCPVDRYTLAQLALQVCSTIESPDHSRSRSVKSRSITSLKIRNRNFLVQSKKRPTERYVRSAWKPPNRIMGCSGYALARGGEIAACATVQ